jgi:hypothetical protein
MATSLTTAAARSTLFDVVGIGESRLEYDDAGRADVPQRVVQAVGGARTLDDDVEVVGGNVGGWKERKRAAHLRELLAAAGVVARDDYRGAGQAHDLGDQETQFAVPYDGDLVGRGDVGQFHDVQSGGEGFGEDGFLLREAGRNDVEVGGQRRGGWRSGVGSIRRKRRRGRLSRAPSGTRNGSPGPRGTVRIRRTGS